MFVDTIAADSTAASFLETIVRMAEILSLQVVVEGIETADQAALIATFGNVFGQGYQLGRPVGVVATDRLLADGIVTLRAPNAASARALQRRPRLVMLAPPAADSSTPRAG
jgi:EAL domain-containing protein (putative c-di-GMP-specific phosphodiesterase class I)